MISRVTVLSAIHPDPWVNILKLLSLELCLFIISYILNENQSTLIY